MTFAERLKIECFNISKTPTSVCTELGFSHGAFTYWRTKNATPNLASINKIANYFGLTGVEFMKGVDGIPSDGKIESVSARGMLKANLTKQEQEIVDIYRSMSLKKQCDFVKLLYQMNGEEI